MLGNYYKANVIHIHKAVVAAVDYHLSFKLRLFWSNRVAEDEKEILF